MSDKVDRRVSSLRREFTNVKEKSFHDTSEHWIQSRLDDGDSDINDMMRLNRK